MATTNNHDILGISKRLRRFAVEVNKSASSAVSGMSLADRARLNSYTAAAQAYKGWVTSQPELDLPETSPTEYECDDTANFSLADAENEMVDDIINMISLLNRELIHSQSSRLPSGLISFDSSRFDTMMAKIDAYLRDYVEVAAPLDLPESSPLTASTGPGRSGVTPLTSR